MLTPRPTYTSCSDLPLWNFIKVSLSGNKTFLYSAKHKPWNTAANLQDVWDNIVEEYNELTNDTKSTYLFSMIRDLTVINNKLFLIQSSVDCLSQSYSKELCDMLKGMGFKYAYNNDETLLRDLKLTISSAKRMLEKKMDLEDELSKMEESSSIPTEKEWSDLLSQLSKYLGYRVDPKETTVMEFISHTQNFNKSNTPKNGE